MFSSSQSVQGGVRRIRSVRKNTDHETPSNSVLGEQFEELERNLGDTSHNCPATRYVTNHSVFPLFGGHSAIFWRTFQDF
jgi:hypothetical protein